MLHPEPKFVSKCMCAGLRVEIVFDSCLLTQLPFARFIDINETSANFASVPRNHTEKIRFLKIYYQGSSKISELRRKIYGFLWRWLIHSAVSGILFASFDKGNFLRLRILFLLFSNRLFFLFFTSIGFFKGQTTSRTVRSRRISCKSTAR